jgi:ureidoglycolate dehydrogenase (NAD+)
MEIATKQGVAVIGVDGSSHPGSMAAMGLYASRNGYISMGFTNTGPKIVSHDGERKYMGTNPICFSAPREKGDPFCLDMATSSVPWNKVEHCRRSGEPLPPGSAVDANGEPTTDAKKVVSLTATGGYKGYGLAAMVEILCCVVTGVPFGHHTKEMYDSNRETYLSEPRNIGQFYMVMRADVCTSFPAFLTAIQQMSDEVRSEPALPGKQVLLAGDPQTLCAQVRSITGVPMDKVVLDSFTKLSEQYGVPFHWQESPFADAGAGSLQGGAQFPYKEPLSPSARL